MQQLCGAGGGRLTGDALPPPKWRPGQAVALRQGPTLVPGVIVAAFRRPHGIPLARYRVAVGGDESWLAATDADLVPAGGGETDPRPAESFSSQEAL